MERARTVAYVMVGAIIGGLIGGHPLARALAKIIPYHDRIGGFGVLFGVGFHLGTIFGVAATLGVCAGMWAGWLLAHRTKRPMTASMSGI